MFLRCRDHVSEPSHRLRDQIVGISRLVNPGERCDRGEIASDEKSVHVGRIVFSRSFLPGRSRDRKIEVHRSAQTRR